MCPIDTRNFNGHLNATKLVRLVVLGHVVQFIQTPKQFTYIDSLLVHSIIPQIFQIHDPLRHSELQVRMSKESQQP